MLDVVLDALLDGLKILPFILLIYVLMEVIENARNKEKIEKMLSGGFAPVAASALGVIPECGFAAMCAKLYDESLIKTGTLIAAFLAVSDEGLIILVSSGVVWYEILIFIGVKIIYAIAVGEILNAIFKGKDVEHVCPSEGDCIECGKHQETNLKKYFLHPLFHALTTFVFLFAVNFLLGLLIYYIGEERFFSFLGDKAYLEPVFSSLIGLIPNCASSIIISQSFVQGVIRFPALISGLSANAGVGLVILFKNKKRFKRNVSIVLAMFILSVLLGYAVMPFYL